MSGKEPMYELAREGSPFSNGTEGYAWFDNWCCQCIHDKPFREGNDGDGCGIWMLALIGKTPAEWIRQAEDRLGDRYHCVEFRDEDEGPPTRTEPLPTPPGQGELLPLEPYVGTRMFADVTTTPGLRNEPNQPEEVER